MKRLNMFDTCFKKRDNLCFNIKHETCHQHLECTTLSFNSLCKLAYGGHIGSNQEIVLLASTTAIVLLLYKVSLISV